MMAGAMHRKHLQSESRTKVEIQLVMIASLFTTEMRLFKNKIRFCEMRLKIMWSRLQFMHFAQYSTCENTTY